MYKVRMIYENNIKLKKKTRINLRNVNDTHHYARIMFTHRWFIPYTSQMQLTDIHTYSLIGLFFIPYIIKRAKIAYFHIYSLLAQKLNLFIVTYAKILSSCVKTTVYLHGQFATT